MDLFKDLVFDTLVKAALQRLFSLVPLLGWGPLGMVISFYLTKFADLLYSGVKEFVEVESIPIKNEALRKEFDRASVKLKIIAGGKGIDSPEFREARNADKENLLKLVTVNRAG
jgi:hypothetical protein